MTQQNFWWNTTYPHRTAWHSVRIVWHGRHPFGAITVGQWFQRVNLIKRRCDRFRFGFRIGAKTLSLRRRGALSSAFGKVQTCCSCCLYHVCRGVKATSRTNRTGPHVRWPFLTYFWFFTSHSHEHSRGVSKGTDGRQIVWYFFSTQTVSQLSEDNAQEDFFYYFQALLVQ